MNAINSNPRRRFLKGLGVSLALPALEISRRSARAGQPAVPSPVRTAFIYVPNGAQQDAWFPSTDGESLKLSRTMQPLGAVKEHVQVITGLDHENAEAGPDGAGDHARANATFLTGMRATKTSGANIHLGQSIDQLIAQHVGHQTKFPSLELTCDAIRKSGGCDSGYSCAYQYNVSWRTAATPMSPEPNPRQVFERLFGDQDPKTQEQRKRRIAEQASVLDFIKEDAKTLNHQLGIADRHKIDEYTTGIRELEKRIERLSQFPSATLDDFSKVEGAIPEEVPRDHAEHIDVMMELLALAFESDTTRVATLLMAHDGSNRTFSELGIREGHHYLTHNQEKQEVCEKVAQIDLFYMNRLAKFLSRLQSSQDAEGRSLLDQSMIVYGSGIADANRHTHDNLPLILAGGGGGSLRGGRLLEAGSQPMCNLFLSLADRMGVANVKRFGDSSGRLSGLG